jgi:pyrophosphate--fructose-6-phosphate 1-phosphotransferase
MGVTQTRLDVHGVYVPELSINLEKEAERLRAILDANDNVNIFISEGAGVKDIVAKMEAEGVEVQRDAFGHVKLDTINPGKYFADTISSMIGAEKVLVQKSGYYSRAAPANKADLKLIQESAQLAVQEACLRGSGVVAMDEDAGDVMRCIEFPRIKGGKPFKTSTPWFQEMLAEIGQPTAAKDAFPVSAN